MIIPVISIRQPWASLIVEGPKAIENRPRRWHHRGLTLIHASSSLAPRELDDARWLIQHRLGFRPEEQAQAQKVLDKAALLPLGGIIGAMQITGCLEVETIPEDARDPWMVGPFALTLAKAQHLPFVLVPGRLGLWRFDYPTSYLPESLQALAQTSPQP